MDDAIGMAVGHSRADLHKEPACLLFGESSSCHDIVKQVSIHRKLLNDAAIMCIVQNVGDINDVWVVGAPELPEDFQFPGQVNLAQFGVGLGLVNDFDGKLWEVRNILIHAVLLDQTAIIASKLKVATDHFFVVHTPASFDDGERSLSYDFAGNDAKEAKQFFQMGRH